MSASCACRRNVKPDGLLGRPRPGRLGGVGPLELGDQAGGVVVERGQQPVVRLGPLRARASSSGGGRAGADRLPPEPLHLGEVPQQVGRAPVGTPGHPRLRVARRPARHGTGVTRGGCGRDSRGSRGSPCGEPSQAHRRAHRHYRRNPLAHEHTAVCIVMHMTRKRVAVAGASGYAGGEVLRLLLGHPEVEIGALTGGSNAGETAGQPPAAPGAAGRPGARADQRRHPRRPRRRLPRRSRTASPASSPPSSASDVLVIDCGADYRLTDPAAWEQFYGGDPRRLLALRPARAPGPARAARRAPPGSPYPAATRPSPRSPSPPPSRPASSSPTSSSSPPPAPAAPARPPSRTCSAAR